MSKPFDPMLPGGLPLRPKKGRNVTGLNKTIPAGVTGGSVQVIDVEYEVPDFFFVDARAFTAIGTASVTWVLEIGQDNGVLTRVEIVGSPFLSYVVLARSVSLIAKVPGTASIPVNVSAIIAPAPSIDTDLFWYRSRYMNTFCAAPVLGSIELAFPATGAIPVVTTSYVVDTAPVSFGYARLGMTIYNNSTAANLKVRLGAEPTVDLYTIKMVPQSYYEVPFGYPLEVYGRWDAAEGGTNAGLVSVINLR